MFRTTPQRLHALAACFALLTLILALPIATQAQTSERCFPQTGFCISGAIRAYWEENGGLPVFGYPIGAERTETIEGTWAGPTQWFERDRLEDHANERKGVLAGRLGAQYLEQTGQAWQRGPGASGYPYNPECRTFYNETGYQVCGSFRAYWEQNGGLARFGYPISEPVAEQLEGKTYFVQYFERRRMEDHPEFAGTPNAVLLGLLGRAVYNAGGAGPVTQPAANDVAGATQQVILDAAWTNVRPSNRSTPLMIGLVDVVGDYAFALAAPRGAQQNLSVYLKHKGLAWSVIDVSAYPMADALRAKGVPEALLGYTDRFAVMVEELARVQDPRGAGLNGYVTRPRVAGDYVRFVMAPAPSAQLDPPTTFFKRERGVWRFLTVGTAFPEDSLRQMGVPAELWPNEEGVWGPNA